jgi:hypothetical protein
MGLSDDCGEGNDLVLLGHIPGWFTARWPAQLHRHREDGEELWAVPWRPNRPGCPLVHRHRAVPRSEITADLLLAGLRQVPPEWAEEPLASAREARFTDLPLGPCGSQMAATPTAKGPGSGAATGRRERGGGHDPPSSISSISSLVG